jgi:drug/metabolite transporter (DMT)-like permease
MLAAAAILWSLNFVAMKYSLAHGFAPLVFASLRWLLSGILLGSLVCRQTPKVSLTRSQALTVLSLALVGVWLNQLSLTYAIRLTPASEVALAFGLLPLVIGIFIHFGNIEKVPMLHWFATLVSLSGVVLIVAGSHASVGHSYVGILLTLVSVMAFAFYSVAAAPLLRYFSAGSIQASTAVVGGCGLAIIGAAQFLTQNWSLSSLTLLAFVYSSVAVLVIGNTLWFRAISRVGPRRASVYVNLQPFLGALFAVILLSESLSTIEILGGLLICAGIVLARLVHPES